MNSINSTNSISIAPCQDMELKKLCAEYMDTLPCCDALRSKCLTPRINRLWQRCKILWNKTDGVDLFELKKELFEYGYFKEIQGIGWSMFPAIKNGDLLKIFPCQIEDLAFDDIAIYRVGNRLCAHRIIDKKIINGKKCLLTRGDTSTEPGGEKVEEEDLLGKVTQIKRGRKILSPEKRRPTVWERLLSKKKSIALKSTILLKKTWEATLSRLWLFKAYKILSRKLVAKLKPHLNFELTVPFANERLKRLYTYTPLKEDKRVDFVKLKKTKIFHLVMKFGNSPVGYATILNRADNCPHKDFCVGDVYIRLRYRGLDFSPIILRKVKEILQKV